MHSRWNKCHTSLSSLQSFLLVQPIVSKRGGSEEGKGWGQSSSTWGRVRSNANAVVHVRTLIDNRFSSESIAINIFSTRLALKTQLSITGNIGSLPVRPQTKSN